MYRKDESVDPNDQSTNSEDMEIKSDEADSTSARGVDSSSGKEEAESTVRYIFIYIWLFHKDNASSHVRA